MIMMMKEGRNERKKRKDLFNKDDSFTGGVVVVVVAVTAYVLLLLHFTKVMVSYSVNGYYCHYSHCHYSHYVRRQHLPTHLVSDVLTRTPYHLESYFETSKMTSPHSYCRHQGVRKQRMKNS